MNCTIKCVLRTQKRDKLGLYPIYLRIIQNRITRYINTGVKVKESDWSPDEEKVKKAHPNSVSVNIFLAQKKAEILEASLNINNQAGVPSAEIIKQKIKGKEQSDDFMDYFSNHLTALKKSGQIGSLDKANAVYSKLKTYLNGKRLTFADITVSFLKEYDLYLKEKLGNSVNTIHSNMKVIRKLIYDAVREEIITIEKNPFLRYKLRTEPTKKTYLTEEELKLVEDVQLTVGSKMNDHRNMYVFSSYGGGLRVSDVLMLKWRYFDGERVVITIHKTRKQINIKLPQKAIEIIKLYDHPKKQPDDFIFPLLSNTLDLTDPVLMDKALSSAIAYTNQDLKKIAKKAGIDKRLHFHSSRHTWATRALRKGMRIEYVSQLMGHSNIKTTQIYTKIVNEDLDNAMKLFDY
jgi:integrase